MHDFRSRGRAPRQAVDGFLNAPQRPHAGPHAGSAANRNSINPDRFRNNGRRVDNFKQPEGFQPTARSINREARPVARPASVQAAHEKQASILHMTLPGGALDNTHRKARKYKEKQKATGKKALFRKWGFRAGIATAGIVLLFGGFLVVKGLLQANKVFKGGGKAAALQSEVTPELLKGEGDGRINILLLGRGGDGHEGPDLTDTLLVVSIDPVNKAANMVSIPRDLWVNASGANTKINAVFANAKYKALAKNSKDKAGAEKAGISAIEDTVTDVLGVPIHYYGMVDFQAFQQAVDTVGGVDISIPESAAVRDYMFNEVTRKPYLLDVKAGQNHFDGLRALMFTRTRHTSARGDFDRTERQRLFISALSNKILSAGTYTNPVKVSQLMSDFGDHIATDFSVSDSLRLAQIMKQVGATNIKSLSLADPPNNYVRTGNINGLSVVIPTAGVGDYTEIHNYIRNAMKDPYLAKENASVMVLNGTTTPGLASNQGDKLKSYGYNVVKVDTAPTQDYQQTTIVDMTNGKKPFTKSYLEKRMNAKVVTALPDPNIQTAGVDFVVILGQDASTNSEN